MPRGFRSQTFNDKAIKLFIGLRIIFLLSGFPWDLIDPVIFSGDINSSITTPYGA